MFKYSTKVINVVDGDTIDVDIDLGFDIHHTTRIRLVGINTPEIRNKNVEEKNKGLVAKARVEELVLGKTILLETLKDRTEKYGRYLGIVYLENGTSLNALLVKEGLAKIYLLGEQKI